MHSSEPPTGSRHRKFDHDLHARACAEQDFWRQIRRTVNGQPVDETQIQMIVAAIRESLQLVAKDRLLDLACGNGALASHFFGDLTSYLGVDFSPTLVNVANKFFSIPPNHVFLEDSVDTYVIKEKRPEYFTKALCYGSFSYFSETVARQVLCHLFDNFIGIEKVLIGNLPDRQHAERFYAQAPVSAAELLDHESTLGIWRSEAEFTELARSCGWHVEVNRMPLDYYAAHYRFDAILSRPV
jgi:SAM-dependent methyltransferase